MKLACDVLHAESKQQTTPAVPRDALECVAALAFTREGRQNCVRFAYLGPHVDCKWAAAAAGTSLRRRLIRDSLGSPVLQSSPSASLDP